MSGIANLLQLVEKEVLEYSSSIQQSPKELYDPIKYILSLGGKRIRPLLVLVACDLYGGELKSAVPVAIGIELFHNFSLIHDDIMDNAPLRRGKSTVHEKWGKNSAILSGDVTLVKAYECLLKTPIEPAVKEKLLTLFCKVAIEVCEGQQLDINFETTLNVSVPQYIRMIEYKTAVLLAASLQMGAIVGGVDQNESLKIYKAGINMGIAFQLQDDILDVYGDDKFGKQIGGDIIANKKTWLLLKALELSKTNHYKYEELVQWQQTTNYSKQKVEAVTAIYDFLNVRELAQKEMNMYFEKGIALLNTLDEDKKRIEEFIEFIRGLMNRTI